MTTQTDRIIRFLARLQHMSGCALIALVVAGAFDADQVLAAFAGAVAGIFIPMGRDR